MRDRCLLTHRQRHVFHDWAMLVSQFRKSRIDIVVENIALKEFDYFVGGVNANRLSQLAKKIINEDRQARDVVHVRMRDDNVANGLSLTLGQRETDAARIDTDAVVDQEARQALCRRRPTGGIE